MFMVVRNGAQTFTTAKEAFVFIESQGFKELVVVEGKQVEKPVPDIPSVMIDKSRVTYDVSKKTYMVGINAVADLASLFSAVGSVPRDAEIRSLLDLPVSTARWVAVNG